MNLPIRYTRLLAVGCSVLLVGITVAFLAIGTGAATAQTTNQTNQTGGEVVTDGLTLVNTSYEPVEDGGNGTLSLTFRADGPQAVTLYDAGAFRQGGQLPSKTKVIEGTVTVEMPVTRQGNFVGVTVVTGNTRYAVPHRIAGESGDSHLFRGRPTWQDTQIAGLSGFAGGLLVISGVAYRRVTKDEGEVTRVL
ncbi:hypothetical protein BV210_15045 [Halorientalis sp. IM1011]|uniref:hypothetical protein n=1 Tax=Halorientalis sp. IM1011 TaxID=1932360 RepID=UPI00097CC6C1|nr:hypothetical protein [Halorientalis sp. IM1011]AQL43937.1 hypothetical protein BV210_15045 [Halorientalis sp. IM1011]